MLSAEWVTAAGTLGTFAVIAASAIAALLQLRHMRSSNQIAAYNECRETMESRDFQSALNFIRNELPHRLEQPGTSEAIARSGLINEYAGIRMVANLFESMGVFVKTGMMDRGIACDLWSGIVVATWRTLRPIISVVRREQDAGAWLNFEYMAAISTRYNDAFPEGEYPAGVPRMPLDG